MTTMRFRICRIWFLALVAAVGIGSASATPLVGRDIDRKAVLANDVNAVYLWDQDLGITWLRNANVQDNNDGNFGRKSWDVQNTWAQNLVTGTGANAITDWRLPATFDKGTPGCNFSNTGGTDCGYSVDPSSSEMAHLFFVTLGNLSCNNPDPSAAFCGAMLEAQGFGLLNVGDFLNLQKGNYWSGTESALSTIQAWRFNFDIGFQRVNDKTSLRRAMAVRDGDVLAAEVPEPGTLALLGLALAGLAATRRRRTA